MATGITQRQLRNDSGDIMRRLDSGETFLLTRNGVPVGELTPLRRQQFIRRDAAKRLFADAPLNDYQRLRADVDAVLDQTAFPRA